MLSEDGATCLGCIYLAPLPGGARLAYWVIDAALDREGALVETVLAWIAREWPLDRVVLATRPTNPRAVPLHAGLGLRDVGEAEVPEHHAFEWRRAPTGTSDP